MTVHDELLVRRLLVLADASLHQRRALQSRKTKLNMTPHVADGLRRGRAISGSRVERGAARVVRRLESAPVVPGDAVIKMRRPVIDPRRHLRFRIAHVTRRNAEEEYFLARRANQVA